MKAILAAIYLGLNTLFWCLLLYFFYLLKIISPLRGLRDLFSRIMVTIAQNWISFNNAMLDVGYDIEWRIEGVEDLDREHSYLVCANHQSWVDILVLQRVFNRRIPFLRFFIKRELVYVPLLNLAWWALDFPFMKRYSKEYLEKHPEKRGQDLLTTKKICEKFRGKRVSIINFLEGTRFTAEKHQKQNSPFKHLLRPKAGGLAFVLEVMGDQFDSLLDVTIRYPDGPVDFWELLGGHLHRVQVHVEKIKIPTEFVQGNYADDPAHREKFQAWVQDIWEKKDRRLSST